MAQEQQRRHGWADQRPADLRQSPATPTVEEDEVEETEEEEDEAETTYHGSGMRATDIERMADAERNQAQEIGRARSRCGCF